MDCCRSRKRERDRERGRVLLQSEASNPKTFSTLPYALCSPQTHAAKEDGVMKLRFNGGKEVKWLRHPGLANFA